MLTCNLINERYDRIIKERYGGKCENEDLILNLMLNIFNDDCINIVACEAALACNDTTVLPCGVTISQDGVTNCPTITITQN